METKTTLFKKQDYLPKALSLRLLNKRISTVIIGFMMMAGYTTAKAQTANGTKQDTADVTVVKTCVTPVTPVTPTQLPVTGAGEGIAAFLGLGATVTSTGYYIASRRLLKR